jgi:hypothetical protein
MLGTGTTIIMLCGPMSQFDGVMIYQAIPVIHKIQDESSYVVSGASRYTSASKNICFPYLPHSHECCLRPVSI